MAEGNSFSGSIRRDARRYPVRAVPRGAILFRRQVLIKANPKATHTITD